MALLTSLTDEQGNTHKLDEAKASAVFDLGDVYYANGNTYQYAYCNSSANTTAGAILTHTAATSVDTVAHGTGVVVYDGVSYNRYQQVLEASAGWTAGQYKGYLGQVDAGTGISIVFKVQNNSTDTLYLEEPLTTDLNVADSDILLFNPYDVKTVTASTDLPVMGVSKTIVYVLFPYFWMQTGGIAKVLIGADASSAAGNYAITGDNTAGTCAIASSTALEDAVVVGNIIIGCSVADTHCWVRLNIK